MAAPLANQNNVKHGMRMTVSALPKGCHFISQSCYQLRRALEEWCLDRRGQVGLWEACCIQSAIRFEQVSQLAARWLREADGTLSHGERLAYASKIAEASAKRDTVLQKLGMDQADNTTIFDALYATPTALDGNGDTATPEAPQATPVADKGKDTTTGGNASESRTEPQEPTA